MPTADAAPPDAARSSPPPAAPGGRSSAAAGGPAPAPSPPPEDARARSPAPAPTPTPPPGRRRHAPTPRRRNRQLSHGDGDQAGSGVAGVLAALATGGIVARPPSRAVSGRTTAPGWDTPDTSYAVTRSPSRATASVACTPGPGADTPEPIAAGGALAGEGPAHERLARPERWEAVSRAAPPAPSSVLLGDAPPPPHRWAAETLASSENVMGCLQTALLRLQSTPAWSLVDSDFTRVALPAVLRAAGLQLEAAEERRQEIFNDVEDLRGRVARREEELAALRERIESQAWFPRQEHLKVEGRFKQAQERANELEARLAVARAELRHLQGTVGEAANAEREALQRRRGEITATRDARARECKELRAQLVEDEDRLAALQREAAGCARGALHSETKAGMLPETEAKLRELQGTWTTLQSQLLELKTKKTSKKGKRK